MIQLILSMFRLNEQRPTLFNRAGKAELERQLARAKSENDTLKSIGYKPLTLNGEEDKGQ